MFTKSRKNAFRYLCCYSILMLSTFLTVYTNYPSLENSYPGDYGIYAFYKMTSMDMLLFVFTALFIIAPLLVSATFFQIQKGFSNFILLRISIQDYLKRVLIKSFSTGFIFFLILQISIILYLHFFYESVIPSLFISTEMYFSRNAVLELLIFVLLSSAGYGIFLMFISTLSMLIKNEYIFYSTGVLVQITSMLLYPCTGAVIVQQLEPYTRRMIPIRSLLSFMVPANLITPGTTFPLEAHYTGWYSFTSTALFFTLLIYLLYRLICSRYKYNRIRCIEHSSNTVSAYHKKSC
jgi:hypothetical protein